MLKSDYEAYKPPEPTPITPKIANGQDVQLRNFSEVVRIQFADDEGDSTCTGTIIARDSILTAGHCGCGSGYRLDIQVGHPGPSSAKYVPLQLVDGPIVFPGYDCVHRAGIGRDLALFKIRPLEIDADGTPKLEDERNGELIIVFPVIRSAALVLDDPELRSLYIVGFGATESGELARNLQGAPVALLSRDCRTGYYALSVCAMYREFVMGHSYADPSAAPADTCGGDSGGPAYRMDGDLKILFGGTIDQPSARTLVGVTSRALFGVNHPYPGYCGGGGIYTAVGTAPVLAWLRQHNVDFSYDPSPLAENPQ
ncbi:trypsin-like serine protease [Mesorhizobium salmacidum]|uniref:Trypsin-like serine protease n=1 Tax=Mesorhizobium salmacidum TaxID=3015171 RepID=A0ABU8L303_9HYPH